MQILPTPTTRRPVPSRAHIYTRTRTEVERWYLCTYFADTHAGERERRTTRPASTLKQRISFIKTHSNK
jgi:hypothetical protein